MDKPASTVTSPPLFGETTVTAQPPRIVEAHARAAFNAYNAEGPNPWKTWDGKDVPRWDDLNDQVRGKWCAAVRAVIGPQRQDARPHLPADVLERKARDAFDAYKTVFPDAYPGWESMNTGKEGWYAVASAIVGPQASAPDTLAISMPQQISITEADIGRTGQFIDENWRRSACVMVGLDPSGYAQLKLIRGDGDVYVGPKPFSRDFRAGFWTLMMP